MHLTDKLSFQKAIFCILLSIVLISGVPTAFIIHKKTRLKSLKKNPKYLITQIIQRSSIKEGLKTAHLAQLLSLSANQPQNIFTFDTARAVELLMGTGIFKKVVVRINLPNSIVIDYELRQPIAYLADYTNTVVDIEGHIFPLSPYHTPKFLPKIYLGSKFSPFIYGKINDPKMDLALKIYNFYVSLGVNQKLILDQIDVSCLNAKSLGKKEIVLSLKEVSSNCIYDKLLRFSASNFEEQFLSFLNLDAMNLPKSLVCDLRMYPNAYISPIANY